MRAALRRRRWRRRMYTWRVQSPHKVDRRQMILGLTSLLCLPHEAGSQTVPPTALFTAAFLREQLPAWPDASRALLLRALSPENGGRIDAQTVNRLVPAAGGSLDALMTLLLPEIGRASCRERV